FALAFPPVTRINIALFNALLTLPNPGPQPGWSEAQSGPIRGERPCNQAPPVAAHQKPRRHSVLPGRPRIALRFIRAAGPRRPNPRTREKSHISAWLFQH